MKFKDIEKFIDAGDYGLDVFIGSIEHTLKDFEDRFGLDLDPEFQRGVVWTEEQQIKYVEYFFRGGKSAKELYFNSPGIKGDEPTGDLGNEIVIVDGLQRLTAIRKFLNNELKAFGHYYDEFEDRNLYLYKYGFRFNINTLQNYEDVLQWYIEMNTGGTVHSDEEIQRVRKLLEEHKTGK